MYIVLLFQLQMSGHIAYMPKMYDFVVRARQEYITIMTSNYDYNYELATGRITISLSFFLSFSYFVDIFQFRVQKARIVS